jgi:hypothetical protein
MSINDKAAANKEERMKSFFGMLLGGVAIVSGMTSSGALAQTAEPTYKADPSVYKVIFEDDNFRVIQAIRNKGVHDKAHGHPVPFVTYNVTDCKTRLYSADGKTTEREAKAGTVQPGVVVGSHSAENIGDAACQQIFVEKK